MGIYGIISNNDFIKTDLISYLTGDKAILRAKSKEQILNCISGSLFGKTPCILVETNDLGVLSENWAIYNNDIDFIFLISPSEKKFVKFACTIYEFSQYTERLLRIILPRKDKIKEVQYILKNYGGSLYGLLPILENLHWNIYKIKWMDQEESIPFIALARSDFFFSQPSLNTLLAVQQMENLEFQIGKIPFSKEYVQLISKYS